jgi:hypothetical protein
MDRFIDTYDHPNLSQKDIHHLNGSIAKHKIEAAKRFSQKRKVQDQMDSQLNL